MSASSDKKSTPTTPSPTGQPHQVGADSIVGANLKIAEKSTIKKSSVGKEVTIGKDSKVSGCVIWDNVVIGDGCASVSLCLSSAD